MRNMGEVVDYPGSTTGPVSPEKILKAALDANLKEVVVIGETQNGTIALYGSTGEAAQLNWLLDCAKKLTMDACFIEGEE